MYAIRSYYALKLGQPFNLFKLFDQLNIRLIYSFRMAFHFGLYVFQRFIQFVSFFCSLLIAVFDVYQLLFVLRYLCTAG